MIAWSLLAAGLLVAGCLVTYAPDADGADNLLGVLGSSLAEALCAGLGLGIYPLLGGWFVLVITLLLRHHLLRWSSRLAGWLLLLPLCTALAAHHGLDGGELGALLAQVLLAGLSAVEATVWLTLATGLALALAFDFVTVQLVSLVGRLSALKLDALRQRLRGIWRRWRAGPQKARPKRLPAPAPAPIQELAGPMVPIVRPAPSTLDPDTDGYALPSLALLRDAEPFPYEKYDQQLRDRAVLLEKTFKDFDLNVRVVGINTGPVITQYEIALETGLRVQKVTRLADDLSLNLMAASVRIVAPIPGKNTVGVEVPNEHRAMVRLKEVILTAGKPALQMKLPLYLGKDAEGRALVQDLADMPHLLIAGRTGTGKSVCMNAIILSVLMTRRPDEVKLIMIDPKRTEMSEYGKIPHLMHPVVTDMKKAEAILAWAVDKMEERYDLLSRARVRSLAAYNELGLEEVLRRVKPEEEERDKIPAKMPYVVLFVDEMADLMMTMKREVEGHIIRLAQKSRAAGIHLVVATQKPTVDVITGLIKSNLPARICFQVSSRTDSRVVLDEMGADKLLGKGDMLYLQPGTSTLIRAQGTYASDEEITRVVTSLECEPAFEQELLQLRAAATEGPGGYLDALRKRDDAYVQAIEVVVRERRGSVSLLQRALGIGYGRAARLIDFMAEDGIVGSYRGSSARDVLLHPEDWEQLKQTGQMPARLQEAH